MLQMAKPVYNTKYGTSLFNAFYCDIARTPEKRRLAVAAIQQYVSENNNDDDNDNDNANDDNNDDNNRPLVNVSYRVLNLDDVEEIRESVTKWLHDDSYSRTN